MKKCGYSFWGYLGDIKYNKNGNIVSTPDGNAFYSWCIIRELQKRGYEVTQIMPDRDKKGFELMGDNLFSSWAEADRVQAYIGTKKVEWYDVGGIDYYRDIIADYKNVIPNVKNFIYSMIEENCKDLEFILHEYRMLIPGRNDFDSILNKNWQSDYIIQECLFDYCCKNHKRLILFDLDYKLDTQTYTNLRDSGCPVCILELGTRWKYYYDIYNGKEIRQVYIPFDFSHIYELKLKGVNERKNNLIYVGNRYERDWCIDKYIPTNIDNCTIYGNWLEGNKDSTDRWPSLNFGKRIQTADMAGIYRDSISTILLAKREYCVFGFMTARIIESIFYGTVPLFIEEYGFQLIKKYAGKYTDILTVTSRDSVCSKIKWLNNMSDNDYICIIEYLRDRLKFMDVKNFIDILMEVK